MMDSNFVVNSNSLTGPSTPNVIDRLTALHTSSATTLMLITRTKVTARELTIVVTDSVVASRKLEVQASCHTVIFAMEAKPISP
mmetsp:Transcript_20584/g.30546  ORF Transcript_20584/g.30546 Transcript_20584/m.30546 type:complete len:84 (-) Transcript_20584:1000-1251(-)